MTRPQKIFGVTLLLAASIVIIDPIIDPWYDPPTKIACWLFPGIGNCQPDVEPTPDPQEPEPDPCAENPQSEQDFFECWPEETE